MNTNGLLNRRLNWWIFTDAKLSSTIHLAGVAVFVLLVGFVSNLYWVHLLTTCCIYYIAILGLNILVGFTGQLSLAQGAFVAISAYTSALMTTKMGLSFWLTGVVAIVISLLVASGLALLTIRAKGFYFAVITLAFAVMFHTLAEKLTFITGGDLGILNIPRPSIMGTPLDDLGYFYFVALSTVLVVVLTKNLVNSRWCRALIALKTSEPAAKAVGIDIYKWKVIAFVVSAAYGGLAGVLMAHQSHFINSGQFGLELSIIMVIAIICGGVGSIYGVGIGAFVVIIIPETLAALMDWHLLFYGIILAAVVILLPEGIAGSIKKLRWIQRFEKPPETPTVSPKDWLLQRKRSQQSDGNLLRIKSLTKDFGGLRALEKVDLDVEPGSITSLIGPNGSGKTTLINTVTGFYRADGGRIFFHNQDITHIPPHKMANLGISRTFQIPALFEELTTLENVMLGFHHELKSTFWGSLLHTRNTVAEEDNYREKALAILNALNLHELAQQKAKNLPLGRKKMLQVARAWASDPELIFLDEPAGGLSLGEMEHLSNVLRIIRDKGTTIFLVEHRMDLVMNISKKIAVLDYGKKISEGEPQQVQNDQRVIEAYLGTEVSVVSPSPAIGTAKESQPQLEVKDLKIYYGPAEAVHGINFRVIPKEIVAVIGSNGAGKSSTLKGICGLAEVNGRVSFEGKDITGIKPHDAVRVGITLVPEGRQIFANHSVMDNLLLGHYRSQKGRKKPQELMELCFHLFPVLKDRERQLGGTLSGGEQQMLAISRGIMADPKLLMLDEPSLGLAPLLVKRIFEALGQLKQHGLTILLVEQMASMALHLAERAYVLETGSIKFEGTRNELLGSPEIRKAYLGEHA